jgi:hypothetical protein
MSKESEEEKRIVLDASDLCALARGKTVVCVGAEVDLDLAPLEVDDLERAIEQLKVRLTELEETMDSDTGDDDSDSDDDDDSEPDLDESEDVDPEEQGE